MSNRIPSLGAFINASRSNLFNTYQAGAGVGGTSASTRAALRRRATLKPGTMANPKSGVCQGLCNRVLTAGGEILVNSNGFLFLIGDAAWATIVTALGGLDASGVPVIPNSMVVNTIPNFESSGKTRVQVIYDSSNNVANSTGFTMFPVTDALNSAGHPNIYTIEITQWGSIPFANTNYYFGRWYGKNSATDTPIFLTNSNLTLAFKDVNIPSSNFGNIGSWDISSCISINSCFSNAINFNEDISGWNVSLVTDMTSVFEVATAFNKNINNWNVSNVIWFEDMFKSATTFNKSLNGWITSSSQQMAGMFQNATSFNQDISGLDVSNVVNMKNMFEDATSFNQDLGNWDISNTNITDMFAGTSSMDNSYNINSSRTLAGWFSTLNAGVSGVPTAPTITEPTGWPGRLFDFSYVFIGSDASFNEAGQAYTVPGAAPYGPVGRWNVSKLTSMHQGFKDNTTFNEDISMWDTANVTQMWAMFVNNTIFNQDISNWDTGKLENTNNMFENATAFNQDLGNWDISNILDMNYMFASTSPMDNSYNINTSRTVAGWLNTKNSGASGVPATVFSGVGGWPGFLFDFSYVFIGADANFAAAGQVYPTLLTTYGPVGRWNVSRLTTMQQGFKDNTTFNEDISMWDTANCTSMTSLFKNALLFQQDIGNWNTTLCASIAAMFSPTNNFNQNLNNWDTSNILNMGDVFGNAIVFNNGLGSGILGTMLWDTSSTTSMDFMFAEAAAFNQDISGWIVSACTAMDGMFRNATSFNQDLGNWDISNTNITNMFSGTSPMDNSYNINSSRTLAGWFNILHAGVSGVPTTPTITEPTGWPGGLFDFSYVFIGSDANFAAAGQVYTVPGAAPYGPVGRWNVSRMIDMSNCFEGNGSFNEDIGMWDTVSATNMAHMFDGAQNFNKDINGWDVSSVTSMAYMFYGNLLFEKNIGSWNMSQVTDTQSMFYDAFVFNSDIGSWITSNIINMKEMFLDAFVFNSDISGWNVGNTTNMENMFQDASSFNQDLGNWDISNTDITNMFSGTSPMDNSYNINSSRTLAGWFNILHAGVSGIPTTPTITEPTGWPGGLFDFSYVFMDLSTFQTAGQAYIAPGAAPYGPVGRWNVSKLTSMKQGFQNRAMFNEDIGMWDTASVTDMDGLFANNSLFNQDIGNWDTGLVQYMNSLFSGATVFNQDISGWNISTVSDMNSMFSGTAFDKDISNWDTSNVSAMAYMFAEAAAFNQDISGWDVSNVSATISMFRNATAFDQDISSWHCGPNTPSTCNISGMFQGATAFLAGTGLGTNHGKIRAAWLSPPNSFSTIDLDAAFILA